MPYSQTECQSFLRAETGPRHCLAAHATEEAEGPRRAKPWQNGQGDCLCHGLAAPKSAIFCRTTARRPSSAPGEAGPQQTNETVTKPLLAELEADMAYDLLPDSSFFL